MTAVPVDLPAVTVDGESLGLGDALALARWRGSLAFLDDARDALLIAREAERRGLGIDADELQEAANAFRRAHRLERADATRRWLEERGLTADEWLHFLGRDALAAKLREAIASPDDVSRYFAENRLRFERAVLSRLSVRDRDVAWELRAQAVDDGVDFHLLARRHSEDDATRPMGGYMGAVERDTLPPAIEAAVWGARPGDIVGPLEAERMWHLVLVEDLRPATLDDATRAAIADLLFEEWLERTRKRAVVTMPLLETSAGR